MFALMVQLLVWTVQALWRAVWLPLAAARIAYRTMLRSSGAWTLVTQDALACVSCGNGVSLVGRWQCGRCGYVFDGFAFARCAVCGAVPPYVPCLCGAGLRNPVRLRPTR